jgi:hypothetical protein
VVARSRSESDIREAASDLVRSSVGWNLHYLIRRARVPERSNPNAFEKDAHRVGGVPTGWAREEASGTGHRSRSRVKSLGFNRLRTAPGRHRGGTLPAPIRHKGEAPHEESKHRCPARFVGDSAASSRVPRTPRTSSSAAACVSRPLRMMALARAVLDGWWVI